MALYRCQSLLIVTITIVVLMVQIDQSSAKRGCSSFGHSCFGGHGKRADEDVLLLPGTDAVFPPSSSGVAAREDGGEDVMIQTAGFGARAPSSSSSLVSPPHQYNLSPFLRQWLQSYRRSTGDIEVK